MLSHKIIQVLSLLVFSSGLMLTLLNCKVRSGYELTKLKGVWINSQGDYIEITDTIGADKAYNHLEVQGIGNQKYLEIKGDTLSFQDRYYSSETNYEKLYVEKFNFIIKSLSGKTLVLEPISELSKKLFGNRKKIELTRQKYATDEAIEFEKIIFHTTLCYGSCPVYHLEVDKEGKVRLHKDKVFKEGHRRPYKIDSLQLGYYYGTLSSGLLNELKNKIQTCNLKTLHYEEIDCCDASTITMIVYYNGQRKYLKSMFPPKMVCGLIQSLYAICENADLNMSDEAFVLEN